MPEDLKPSQHVNKRGMCLVCGCSTLHDGFMSCKGHTPDEKPAEDTGPTEAEKAAILGLKSLKQDIDRLAQKFDDFGVPRKKHRGPRRKLPRCPKCGAKPTLYHEYWAGHAITFGTLESGAPEEDGNMESGYPTHVEAKCDCGHQWRLKGILQITDLHDLEG